MKIERRYYSKWQAAASRAEEAPQGTSAGSVADARKVAQFRQLVPRLLAMAKQAELDIVIEEDLPDLTGYVRLQAGSLVLFPAGDDAVFSALADLFRLAGGAAFDARERTVRLEIWVDFAPPSPGL